MSKFIAGYGVGTTLQGLATYSDLVTGLGLFVTAAGLFGMWVDHKLAKREQ